MTPELIAAVAAGGVVTLAGFGALAFAKDQRDRRLALRIAERVAPLAPAHARPRPLYEKLGLESLVDRWHSRLAWVFGYRPDRAAAYPLRVSFLLAILVIPALALERVASLAAGFPLESALPLFWLGSSQLLFHTLHAWYADKLYRQFPDVLAMIVRSVRAGIPLHEALRAVARESLEPSAAQFGRVVDQMAIGMRLEEALRDAASRTGVAEYAFFTVALTLENLAEVIRKRVALRMRAVALASEARTSAYILAALPLVTGAALAVLNYDYLRPLFETRSGNRLLFFAIFLLCLAGTVMRMLIKRSLR